MKAYASFLAMLFLSACASVPDYESISEDTMNAEVIFERGFTKKLGFGQGATQDYIIYEGGDCQKPQVAAGFTSLTKGSKVIRVAGDQSVIFVATIADSQAKEPIANSSLTRLKYACRIWVKFTPNSGESYRIIHSGDPESCELEIIESSTGENITNFEQKEPEFESYKCE